MTETQEREQKIYDYFQEMAQTKGITVIEFRDWLENADFNNAHCGEYISDAESRFKRMRHEFADLLRAEKEGKKYRYFIDGALDTSLYNTHVKIKRPINNAFGTNGIKIRYKMFPPKNMINEITFYPEYKRIYNGEVYIYGIAIDSEGQRYNIVNDCKTDSFTQLNIGRIVSIKILDRKQYPFVKTFDTPKQWKEAFEYVIGVDPIPDREPMELLMYVKNTFKSRFDTQPLAKFVTAVEKESNLDGYTLYRLKIKQNRELERIILSYGSDVIVKSPDKIQQVIAKEIKKLNEYYKGEE